MNFKWSGMERLAGEDTLRFGLQWISAKYAPFTFIAEISPSLAAALRPAPEPGPPPAVAAVHAAEPPRVPRPGSRPPNWNCLWMWNWM